MKLIMIAAPEKFRDEELFVPLEAFKVKGFEVDVASTRTGEGTGMLGKTFTFDKAIEDIYITDYQAVVVVGGYGSVEYLWDNPILHRLLQQANEKNKVIAAICVSPVVLAKAGLLQDKKATVWDMPESQEAFKEAGATYTGEAVTKDGLIITGNGPEAAQAFADAIIETLANTPQPV